MALCELTELALAFQDLVGCHSPLACIQNYCGIMLHDNLDFHKATMASEAKWDCLYVLANQKAREGAHEKLGALDMLTSHSQDECEVHVLVCEFSQVAKTHALVTLQLSCTVL